METLTLLNRLIGIIFLLCYSYQFCYISLVWRRRRRALPPAAPLPNRFAVLICARNEEAVIGDLLESLRRQTYRRGGVTVFVMADNCTDRTTATEWRAIRTAAWKKAAYAFTFPLFMVTYLPIALCALFSAGEWKPITHRLSAAALRRRPEQDALPF